MCFVNMYLDYISCKSGQRLAIINGSIWDIWGVFLGHDEVVL